MRTENASTIVIVSKRRIIPAFTLVDAYTHILFIVQSQTKPGIKAE